MHKFWNKIENKLCNFIVLYRSPSQSQESLESFIDNLELNIDATTTKNPYLIGILGDFNATLNTWCISDKSTYKGSRIDDLISNYGLQHLKNELTHRCTHTKSSNGVRCPSLITSKLSSSNCWWKRKVSLFNKTIKNILSN